MRNITITLDEDMAAWLREQASRQQISVSRFIGDLVHEHMSRGSEYQAAMRRFLAHQPFRFVWADGRRPSREEIHDRARARDELARECESREVGQQGEQKLTNTEHRDGG